MEVTGDAVAKAVLSRYRDLPKKRKPQIRADGLREWVPLSGIVADLDGDLTCIALGTGMKCLSESKVSMAKGMILHDWHAEVVCIRAFNHFLLQECNSVLSGHISYYIQVRPKASRSPSHTQPFSLRPGIKLYMYNSEAPCGDASMELTISAQADCTPWEVPASAASIDPGSLLSGRGYFSQLGVVRRKPSRPDAPPTLSKSCSDKMSMWQVTSLLSSVTSLLISPQNLYLCAIVLPTSQYSESGCARAFGAHGRMAAMSGFESNAGYGFHLFRILTTELQFESSRSSAAANEKIVPCNLAAVWNCHVEESLIGGVLQGRKIGDVKGANAICRKNMLALAQKIARGSDEKTQLASDMRNAFEVKTYGELKTNIALKSRKEVKDMVISKALHGWTRNVKDDFSC